MANACDNCADVPNNDPDDPTIPDDTVNSQDDLDADGVRDVCDTCVSDRLKITPGLCGCGTSYSDADADGTADCNDQCPNNANEVIPGACGCGIVEADANGNGVFDCQPGPDLKALLQNLHNGVNALKTSKKPTMTQAQALGGLLAQTQAVANASAGQIAVAGVNLQGELSNLSKALTKVFKAKGKPLVKGKKNTLAILQRLIGAIA